MHQIGEDLWAGRAGSPWAAFGVGVKKNGSREWDTFFFSILELGSGKPKIIG